MKFQVATKSSRYPIHVAGSLRTCKPAKIIQALAERPRTEWEPFHPDQAKNTFGFLDQLAAFGRAGGWRVASPTATTQEWVFLLHGSWIVLLLQGEAFVFQMGRLPLSSHFVGPINSRCYRRSDRRRESLNTGLWRAWSRKAPRVRWTATIRGGLRFHRRNPIGIHRRSPIPPFSVQVRVHQIPKGAEDLVVSSLASVLHDTPLSPSAN